MKSVKQQYIDLKEGKMTQAQFMRNIRMSLPEYITNVTSFNDTVKILRNKAILTEADIKSPITINGKIVRTYTQNGDKSYTVNYDNGDTETIMVSNDGWDSIDTLRKNATSLNESYTTNTSGKELYSRFAEIDNLNGQEVLIGIDYEIEKNCDLTKKEATKIVIKNLKKNQFYYTDTLMSGVEGYKAQYMNKFKPNSDQMRDVKSNDLVDKTNDMTSPKGIEKAKASSNKAHKETNKPEGTIKMMSLVAKSSRGVKKMDATGEKMKKLALKENQGVDLNTFNNMLNNHDWYYRMSDDERVYEAGKVMEDKLQMLARELGQEGIDAYNDVQLKIFPKKAPLTLEKTSSTFEKIKSDNPSNPKLDALKDKINKMVMKEYSTMPGGDNMTDVAGHQMDEAKASSLSIGDKFKIAADLGKFVMGEEVEVISVEPFGNDIRLILSNGKDKDDFYLDRNDEI